MKNILEYYYHFANISLHYSNGVYSFLKDNRFYLWKEISRSLEEMREIYQLLLRYPSVYHKIILNRDQQIVTFLDQKPYMLLEVIAKEDGIISIDYLLRRDNDLQDIGNFSLLPRMNWAELWSRKIDYYEYQMEHIENKYPLLASSINYYIGLAENAISYVEDAKLHEKKEPQDHATFSHIRMYVFTSIRDYYDPFTIILDHKARDIAGYLKSAFFSDADQEKMVRRILRESKFSRYGYRILLGRMLYPSYYFDLYDQIILGEREEKEIKKVIQKAEAYRKYVRMIYHYINEIVEIPKIDWL